MATALTLTLTLPQAADSPVSAGPARLSPARRAVGEFTGDWRDVAEAQRLLSQFVENFPASYPEWHMARKDYVLTRDDWKVFVGSEVDRLRIIAEQTYDAAEALHDQGDSKSLDNWVRTPSVDQYLETLWLEISYPQGGEA